MAVTSIFLVSNMHCPSCVSYAQHVLCDIPDILPPPRVSLIEHTIRVKHTNPDTQHLILKALLKAAFEVQHVTTLDSTGRSTDCDVIPEPTTSSASRSTWLMSKAQRKHIENCKACQRDRDQAKFQIKSKMPFPNAMHVSRFKRPSKDNATTDVEKPAIITFDGASHQLPTSSYTATLAISGMTCSSCVTTIKKVVGDLPFVTSIDVNLVANSATTTFQGPETNIQKVIQAIEDTGYDATIHHIEQENAGRNQINHLYKTSISIAGMTCGSCVGTISNGLRELNFVHSADIDFVGNNGTVLFEGKDNLGALLEKIDDLGYDAVAVTTEPVSHSDSSQPRSTERDVQIQISGMFCDHCQTNIKSSFSGSASLQQQPYTVTQWPTLEDPIISITYNPAPPNFTVRDFIKTISDTHEAFSASVYHAPTLEERSRRMQRAEQKHLLWRLVFTAIIAVPSFIIGIVFMSLVPKLSLTRQWFEQPILGGNAMRIDWVLFFITTPVMFYGTDIFHRRALKEIWAMWRPRSRVPLFRRFYRFGSMNLLISAGTSVAYFSSLAVLIMDATSKPMPSHNDRSATSYFDTVTFLTFFILIGRFLEAYSKTKTGDAVALLSKLRPSEGLLVEQPFDSQNTVRTVPVDQLEIGDVVQIPHGASPPTDGIVDQAGSFLFDETSLTGESRPVKKSSGEGVFTGSVNVSAPVRIKVTEIEGTSMLDRIVNVVRDGQAKRAPIERVGDFITGYFVPVITLLALLTWIIWLSLGQSGSLPEAWLDAGQGGWPFWSLKFAIAVFVVSCPCGIGLAAPTALFVGGGLAAKKGILVQGGGEAFQDASTLNAIVFDKTGTLTEGQMKVTDFEILQAEQLGDPAEDVVLVMARVMESSSTHPIAKAIAEYATQRPSSLQFEHSKLEEIPGQGITCSFTFNQDSRNLQYEAAIGNERILQCTSDRDLEDFDSESAVTPTEKQSRPLSTCQDFFLAPALQKYQALGRSTATLAIRHIADDSSKPLEPNRSFKPVAIFAVADPIRAKAASVLQNLRESNLDVHMCTGDNQTTALAIASQLGIPASNVRAGVLPQEKAAYIRELQGLSQDYAAATTHKRNVVAFVGDGTNDTPALSAADVSIALASGSDVAITTASFILLNSDLKTILSLVRLAKRVFLRVKMNFAWAAVYNICLIPVAAGVFFAIGANDSHGGWKLSPVWASAAMALSSVSVVASSLALKLPELRLEVKKSNWC
ncbi:uncharacterized protein A1O9_02345 [Exophiala aquamarina CBS 119918]|uniref:HMA domain-containing protein n=1 Tax=Exophiala aquamarina CBS 119918 TaxID=1182545 RepID=A0A072PNA2_9EURO|nr:uncharacterized protein A1O9_02345 [Exophiala aquamarina CBS 119918]KEF60783.1 hypothetical protein A1O9_02345 [Exophiala aquamarina CBS 119918]